VCARKRRMPARKLLHMLARIMRPEEIEVARNSLAAGGDVLFLDDDGPPNVWALMMTFWDFIQPARRCGPRCGTDAPEHRRGPQELARPLLGVFLYMPFSSLVSLLRRVSGFSRLLMRGRLLSFALRLRFAARRFISVLWRVEHWESFSPPSVQLGCDWINPVTFEP
jgi:hypothetical protein